MSIKHNFLLSALLWIAAFGQIYAQAEDVNQTALALNRDDNQIIIITSPEKDGIRLPSEQEILSILDNIKHAELEEYFDEASDEPLLQDLPTPSRCIRRIDNEKLGFSELTFANGVTAIVKQTDFKNDEIYFQAFSPGGTSLYLDEDYLSAYYAASVIKASGIADFSPVELSKKLSAHQIAISPYISNLYEGINGYSTPKDFETLLQMNYLYFTAPRRDEQYFDILKSKLRTEHNNAWQVPQKAFTDTMSQVINSRSPRYLYLLNNEQINTISLDKIHQIYHDRFANASDFTFLIVGNIDINKNLPLLELYLGGLPSTGRVETWEDRLSTFPTGINDFDFERNSEEQSSVHIVMKSDFKWSDKEQLCLDLLQDILAIRLRESMREEQGGVYGVGAYLSYSHYPRPLFNAQFVWGCAPENVDALTNTLFAEIAKIQANAPIADDILKVKETKIRAYETALQTNSFWISALQDFRKGDTSRILTNIDEYRKFIASISAKDIRNAARRYLSLNNYVRGKLMPAKN